MFRRAFEIALLTDHVATPYRRYGLISEDMRYMYFAPIVLDLVVVSLRIISLAIPQMHLLCTPPVCLLDKQGPKICSGVPIRTSRSYQAPERNT